MNIIKWIQVGVGIFVLLFTSVVFFFIEPKTTALFVALGSIIAAELGYFGRMAYKVKVENEK